MAAVISQPLNIPVIVRSLGQDMYRFSMILDGKFQPRLELISYLDGNLSSNGLNDPALAVRLFDLPWWTKEQMPSGNSFYLCSKTLRSALDHYCHALAEALIAFGALHNIMNYTNELNKPAYTWHSSVNNNLLNDPNKCTQF